MLQKISWLISISAWLILLLGFMVAMTLRTEPVGTQIMTPHTFTQILAILGAASFSLIGFVLCGMQLLFGMRSKELWHGLAISACYLLPFATLLSFRDHI